MNTVHATAVASPETAGSLVCAVLLVGPPGAGKSDLALRLLDRGWRLVADDRVALQVDAQGRVLASAPPVLAGMIEARGLGILKAPTYAGPVPLVLVLDLAVAPDRLPEVGRWPVPAFVASERAPAYLPCLAFDPRPASAAILVEQALRLHGLCEETWAYDMSDVSPSLATPMLPLLAVSGMSGAGRSTALKALEDLGYEVVDNLPLALVDTLITAAPETEDRRPFAFGIDSRTRGFDADTLVSQLSTFKAAGHDIRLIYLDCADDELMRRFSETRRRHPLALDRPALDGITHERELTAALRRSADLVIDTSDLNAADLRRRIAGLLGQSPQSQLTITLQSFGFANGLPRSADLVFDMRFLANPHWEPALRPLTGEDPRVAAHVEADPAYAPALDRIADLLLTLLPGYAREGKSYLTIAIGCTGGRHRSVAVSRALQARLAAAGHPAALSHRDINRLRADAEPEAIGEPALTTPGPSVQRRPR